MNLHHCSQRHSVNTSDLGFINQYQEPYAAIYYVKNVYHKEGYKHYVDLYRFNIARETAFFYFFHTGERVCKKLNGSLYALTPKEALTKALDRAYRYFDILNHRARAVSEFIQSTKIDLAFELRAFEAIARTYADPDDIPHELLKELPPKPNKDLLW